LLSIKNKGNRYDYKEHEEYYLKKLKDSKCETPRSLAKKELRADLYRLRKKKEEEEKGEKVKTSRKTPSTHKSNNLFLSPKLPPKLSNKSREKDIKNGFKKGLDKAVSPGMRKSRN
jgi:superoxide dismutase